MRLPNSIRSFSSTGKAFALLVAMCAISFPSGRYLPGIGHADDNAPLTGNHPNEAETSRTIGNADPSIHLQMQIRFALRNRPALDKLLAEQQDSASRRYHKWLTPEVFNRRFGPSKSEVKAVRAWLTSEGFTVSNNSGASLEFSGVAIQAQHTFGVRIAKFGDGSVYANTSDPVIPRRFSQVIGAVLGMDNMVHTAPVTQGHKLASNADSQPSGPLVRSQVPIQLAQLESVPSAIVGNSLSFGPADLRTFYDQTIGPGQDGSGDCIAIVGTSDFLDSTMTAFTSQFGMRAINYTRELHGGNPGINSAEAEAELDLQWSHVSAPGASIVFHLGNDLVSDIYGAVSDNACGAISISYGFCGVSSAFMTNTLDPIFKQAAAQGQSVFVSSGDWGAAGLQLNANASACVKGSSRSVNEMAADPNVTAVGGTQFNPNFVSGIDQGYATESAWNDSTGATGGGASQVFAKPAYQTGAGIPNDGVRDIPDVALIASPQSPGVFWAHDESGSAQVECCIGGTSLSAPVWAGFSRVLQQITGGSRLGNLNPVIYKLANTQYSTAGFHDVTVGDNNYNGVAGFNAGPGYDLASGWGTIDFSTFASALSTLSSPSGTPTASRTATPTATRTATATATRTATRTATPTATSTPSPTGTRSAAPTPKPSASPSAVPTPVGGGSLSAPLSVTFPAVQAGSRRVVSSFVISNASPSSTLSLNLGSLAQPFTMFYPGRYSVRPGSGVQVWIYFWPGKAGSFTQNLIVTSSDPKHPQVNIPIGAVAR